MTRTWRRTAALATMVGVGLLTTMLAIATVALVVTDPVRTVDALNAGDAGMVIDALASLVWRAITAVIEYL